MQGERYLVSGDDGIVWGCGFTQLYSDTLAAEWASAGYATGGRRQRSMRLLTDTTKEGSVRAPPSRCIRSQTGPATEAGVSEVRWSYQSLAA